jgi:hypothetical protein
VGVTNVIQDNIKRVIEKAEGARSAGDQKEAYKLLDDSLREEIHGLKKFPEHPFTEIFEYALVTSAAKAKDKKYKEASEHIQQTFENVLNCTDCNASGGVMTEGEMAACPEGMDRVGWYADELKNYKFVFLIWYRGSW